MKILFFCRRFYPDIGGVEKHVFEIGKRLAKKGHEVAVITEKSSTQVYSQISRHTKAKIISNIKIIRINAGKDNWFKKFRIWKNLWNLKKLIKEADIVHCHDVFFWYLPFRFLFPSKPIYTTFHGYEGFPIKRRAILIRKISEKLSWGNICIGNFIKKWYGTNATFVSYGGVNVTTKNQEPGTRNQMSAVFIGRLDEQTGILTYVKAFEILKKKYPKFEFAVVGDGKYKKLIEKKVKVLGFQKNPKKYLYRYNFAFVSRYLSILEAFVARKLVFAVYDNPVKRDYLKMSPFAKWIIAGETSEKVAKKIQYYLNNLEEEKKIIEEEFKWVKNQTWDKVVNTYLKLWKIK